MILIDLSSFGIFGILKTQVGRQVQDLKKKGP
jgi:hypothetical protein